MPEYDAYIAGHDGHFQSVASLTPAPMTAKLQMDIAATRDIADELAFRVAVRQSEIRYRRLFEAAHDGVLILDAVSRKITDANPFMCRLLGYRHGELLGKEL